MGIHSYENILAEINLPLMIMYIEFRDTGLSTVLLGAAGEPNNKNPAKTTRHETKYGITSFVYRSRRPFHPGRLYEQFIEPYFMLSSEVESESEYEQQQFQLNKLQKQAKMKQAKRVEKLGELLRSKGFLWMATSNSMVGGWQQAGNALTGKRNLT